MLTVAASPRVSLTSSRTFPDHLSLSLRSPSSPGAGVTGLPAFWVQDAGGRGARLLGAVVRVPGDSQLPEPEELMRQEGPSRSLEGARPRDTSILTLAPGRRGHAGHPEPPGTWQSVAAARRLTYVAHTCGRTRTRREARTQSSREVIA